MKWLRKSQSAGFALVEAILAATLLLVIVTGIAGSIYLGTEGTIIGGQQTQASQIAEEGVEAVRNIRDEGFAAFASIADGDYGLTQSGGVWQLSGSSDTTDGFTRVVNVSTIDADTREITVTVTWQQNLQRNGQLVSSTRLTNWPGPASNPQSIRATEYYISAGFVGTNYTLTLDQDLESDYFVIVRGADGNDTTGGNYGPDDVYARLINDPFGTGELGTSAASDQIDLQRGATGSGGTWQGVVTVVECLSDCARSGFQLVDANTVTHAGNNTSGAEATSNSWSDINQVMMIGGYKGSGCETNQASTARYTVCFARIFPSGTNTINWTRDNTSGALTNADSTVMTVEWGNEWTVQRQNVTGTNGGNGANAVGEYDTAAIGSVTRANTWVWGTGHTNDNGIGDASEAVLITLGDGVSNAPNETQVAVGIEYSQIKDYEVYALSHPLLAVDYNFKADGHSGNLTYNSTTNPATDDKARMAQIYNGQNGTGTAFPRPVFSARYTGDTNIEVQRRRSGQNWPAWIQGIDFSAVIETADTTPPADVSDLALSGETINSVDLAWTAPGDDGNTGTATTYDVRYSTSAITAGNWGSATQATGEPAPSAAGSPETMTVSGLNSNTTYYFAIKTSDEVPNESNISNVPSTNTLPSMADNLVADGSAAYIHSCCSGVWITNYSLTNISATDSVIIDRMTATWTGGAASNINGIYLTDGWKYGPGAPVPSGTNIDIVNFPIAAATGPLTFNWLNFDGDMNGSSLDLTFTMLDGSTETINMNFDSTPPADITDLALSGETTSSINLAWTAPGDDGNVGTATTYDVRYSTSPITAGNWATATQATGEPTPSVAGSAESMTVSGLNSNTTYYFAIRTSDEVPNESNNSNVPFTATLPTMADNLVVDGSFTNVFPCCSGVWVRDYRLTNASATDTITIDRMTVTWTGGGASNVQGIYLTDGWKFGPGTPVASGTDNDITDFSIAPSTGPLTNNWLNFDGDMNGSTLDLTFTMTDGSTRTITGISL